MAAVNWDDFLAALADVPFVADACKRVGVSRTAAYKRRKANDEFRAAWDEALAEAREALAGKYYRMVRDGWIPGPCPACDGAGKKDARRCATCFGSGREDAAKPDADGIKFFLRAIWREQFGKEETILVDDKRPVIRLKIVGGSPTLSEGEPSTS